MFTDNAKYLDDGKIRHIKYRRGYEIEAEYLYNVTVTAHRYEQAEREALEMFNIALPAGVELAVDVTDYDWVKEPCYMVHGE